MQRQTPLLVPLTLVARPSAALGVSPGILGVSGERRNCRPWSPRARFPPARAGTTPLDAKNRAVAAPALGQHHHRRQPVTRAGERRRDVGQDGDGFLDT
jgi:hypothetical protein